MFYFAPHLKPTVGHGFFNSKSTVCVEFWIPHRPHRDLYVQWSRFQDFRIYTNNDNGVMMQMILWERLLKILDLSWQLFKFFLKICGSLSNDFNHPLRRTASCQVCLKLSPKCEANTGTVDHASELAEACSFKYELKIKSLRIAYKSKLYYRSRTAFSLIAYWILHGRVRCWF